MVLQLVNHILLLSCLIIAAVSEAPMAKENCQERCGNITVPFPFGIGKGCYIDEWFEVVCVNGNNSANPVPVLKRVNMELLRINLYGYLDAKFPITFWNCSDRKTQLQNIPNLQGSPFVFSYDDSMFTSVGCGATAVISTEGQDGSIQVAGCSSSCTSWCQTSIPTNLQAFNISFLDKEFGISEKADCRYAFLVNQTWLSEPSVGNLSSLYEMTDVPVVLKWGLNSSNPPCMKPGTYYGNESLGHICRCEDGFDGNPYLPNGCQGKPF
ncbi:hypothetical protein TIFTF001_015132 [Ficus carica]|uniref:Wall-associated receptor kinase galacturonan-binding domain-containing protein n=1 Tax=Ficus carica TaxID=3494 RepID=A0AA88AH86_FICCA|nr:hypothetical protein TIFTF001_015132 [Ficus carica]